MHVRMELPLVALLALSACVEVETDLDSEDQTNDSTVGPSTSQTVDLHTWYSPSRNDYMTTSSSGWLGSAGETRSPDYRWVRVEGRVWRPDRPQPRETVGLHLWWRASSADNLLMAGTDYDGWLRSQGFTHVRLEGYAYERGMAGTVGLNFHSGSDYATSADPLWSSSSHTFWRTLGFIFAPGHWEAQAPDPELFGYRRLEVTGQRPLLIIVRNDVPSRAGTSNNSTFYRQMLMSGSRNIPGFFTANSYRNFTFTDAGVIDIFTSNDGDTSPLVQAGRAGINFNSFDRNADGSITRDELAVVVINKWNDFCGQTRPVACTRPPGSSVDVCLDKVTFVGEKVSFSTVAHELAHQLEMWHTYGPDGSWNGNSTTGAATCFSNNDRQTFHMDPWHKMAWGWIEPRIISLDEPAALETLNAPGAFGTAPTYGKRPVILFHPDKGLDEFFMLEAREQDGVYDRNVADNGMAVWLINLTDDRVPADVFFQADSDPELDHIFGIRLFHGPDRGGVTGPQGGFGRFFRDGDGPVELTWGDGTAVERSLEFEFTDATRRTGHVQIGRDTSFRARLDTLRSLASPGGTLRLKGVFGLPDPRNAYLWGPGGSVQLPVVSWTPEGNSTFSIPSWLPGGDYQVVIRGPHSWVVSNPVDVRVD